MRILVIGDIFPGKNLNYVYDNISKLKRENAIDMIIANAENSAVGNGMMPNDITQLFNSGVDVITGGNHSFDRREIYDMLDEHPFLLRPINYPKSVPGKGICKVDFGRTIVGVINAVGVVLMAPMSDPFDAVEQAITTLKNEGVKIIIVDFHAEATAEKRAMGYMCDGKVSALYGTHTHVQTNDDQILQGGTGYITDIGMCGSLDSVIGLKCSNALEKLRKKIPIRGEVEQENTMINGCIFDISADTGRCISITKINSSK